MKRTPYDLEWLVTISPYNNETQEYTVDILGIDSLQELYSVLPFSPDKVVVKKIYTGNGVDSPEIDEAVLKRFFKKGLNETVDLTEVMNNIFDVCVQYGMEWDMQLVTFVFLEAARIEESEVKKLVNKKVVTIEEGAIWDQVDDEECMRLWDKEGVIDLQEAAKEAYSHWEMTEGGARKKTYYDEDDLENPLSSLDWYDWFIELAEDTLAEYADAIFVNYKGIRYISFRTDINTNVGSEGDQYLLESIIDAFKY